MPTSPSDDRNQISLETYELDYVLRKWGKAASSSNRLILAAELRKFKADPAWSPHNRARFYEYADAQGIRRLLLDSGEKSEPTTEFLESKETDHPYTVIKGWGPPEQKSPAPGEPRREAEPPLRQERPPQEPLLPGGEKTMQPKPPAQERPLEPPPLRQETAPKEPKPLSQAAPEIQTPAAEIPRPVGAKPKKSRAVPIIIIACALAVAAAILFLFIFKWQAPTPAAPIITASETPMRTVTEETLEEDETGALIAKFRQTVQDNSPLYFVPDLEFMLPGEEGKLDNILRGLQGLKKVALSVTGHTGDAGIPGPQAILSDERALTVKNYLLENAGGVDLSVNASGKGATEPVVKDVPLDLQAPNRRVEISVDSAE